MSLLLKCNIIRKKSRVIKGDSHEAPIRKIDAVIARSKT